MIPHGNTTTTATGVYRETGTFLDITPTGRYDIRGVGKSSLNTDGTLKSGESGGGDGDTTYYPVEVSLVATVSVYTLLNNSKQFIVAQKTITIKKGTRGSWATNGYLGYSATVNENISEFLSFSALGHIGAASSASVGYRVEVSVQRSVSGSGPVNVTASLSAVADNAYAYLNRF